MMQEVCPYVIIAKASQYEVYPKGEHKNKERMVTSFPSGPQNTLEINLCGSICKVLKCRFNKVG